MPLPLELQGLLLRSYQVYLWQGNSVYWRLVVLIERAPQWSNFQVHGWVTTEAKRKQPNPMARHNSASSLLTLILFIWYLCLSLIYASQHNPTQTYIQNKVVQETVKKLTHYKRQQEQFKKKTSFSFCSLSPYYGQQMGAGTKAIRTNSIVKYQELLRKPVNIQHFQCEKLEMLSL